MTFGSGVGVTKPNVRYALVTPTPGLLLGQGHYINSICVEEDGYGKADPNVDNLVLVLLHTRRCCALRTASTLNDKPGNHRFIIDALPFLSIWVPQKPHPVLSQSPLR